MSQRASSVRALACFAVASAFFACAGLKRADDPADSGTDGGGDEQTTSGDSGGRADGASADGATPDAGVAPTDFECPTDPWTKVTKTKPECAPRQVKDVDGVAVIDPNGISIARTPAGRVGIAYNDEQNADTGDFHLAHFTPTTATYAAPKNVKLPGSLGFHAGYRSKLAASGPDTLAVLVYNMDDTQNGEVHLRKLVAGVEPLTDDLMSTGVANPTEIAIASDPAGKIYTTVRLSTGATSAKLSTKTKTATGPFTALPDITTDLVPKNAPGAGGASLLVDSGGQVHLLYHFNESITPQHSNPRYHTLGGTTWSYRKTVDNNIIDGLSGFSPRIAVFGTKKYAAYYFRKAQQSIPVTADLRLATWDAALDTPSIEILDQQIPSPDVLYPAYRVAMAVDKFGLVHLAMLRPTSSTAGFLEYRRQIRLASGGTKWLSDIVDPDVLSDLSTAYVDMVVDENARPHIAYVSAKDGRVKYATRFDR